MQATEKKIQKPELLAPAGSVNVFERAVAAGADAVYIGAPALNARALARDFSPAEIAAMIDYAHSRGVKLYLAANSLLKESEIPQAVETLAMLEALGPDALIVQDLGLYHLCRSYFPKLRLHASTLLGAHNSLAVKQFAELGFARVVLARELTLKEISSIASKTDVELEVFIHGALCFSYSGLCLFSSYLGGKSGLRGRCVQPCRRRYRWKQQGGKPGYLFSMSDLNGIEIISNLQQAGVTSLKIEGRLKSSHYVASVVSAYRMVIDAGGKDRQVMTEARELLDQAMGRKSSKGYFLNGQAKELISPYHSGNIGIFLGRAVKASAGRKMTLKAKYPVQVGDRLRLHQEDSGERFGFTLVRMTKKNRNVSRADAGETVTMEVPVPATKGDSLYIVDTRKARRAEKDRSEIDADKYRQAVKAQLNKSRKKVAGIQKNLLPGKGRSRKSGPGKRRPARGKAANRLQLYIKTDDLGVLKSRLPVKPELYLVELNRSTLGRLNKQKRTLKKVQHKVAWCLPPVILEGDLGFYRDAVRRLIKTGFRTWQIGHIGQQLLFSRRDRVRLLGNYTLNILNGQALHVVASSGLKRTQLSIEIDREGLFDLLGSRSAIESRVDPGMTVYGLVPLFTARPMASHFLYGKTLVSPKDESFVLHKTFDSTIALADKPFSLLPKLNELAGAGLKYGIIDLSHRRAVQSEIDDIGRELAGRRTRQKLSMFNYNGTLY